MNFLLLSFSVIYSTSLALGNELARGFNDDINWVKFEEGLEIAKAENKPLMLLFHKKWCGACKALKPQFVTSLQLQEESKHFVMVNLEDDEGPTGQEYLPDGGYIPRIFFLRPDGTIMRDVYNKDGNKSYMYFYSSVELILKSMALARQKVFGGAEVGEL